MNYKTEEDIYKAGGRISENYRGLKNYLDKIDSYALDVLCALGMASNKEEYLKYSHTYITTLKRAYVAKKVDKIALKVEEAVKEADSEGREYKGIPIIDKFATSKNIGEDIFFDAIRFSPEEGLTVDIPSFAEIYRSQTEAEQSETYKKHKAAAEAVNSFFGNMVITDREMERYFQLYGGKVRPNPKSVNVESYMRLKW